MATNKQMIKKIKDLEWENCLLTAEVEVLKIQLQEAEERLKAAERELEIKE
jgi:hypothetical protein